MPKIFKVLYKLKNLKPQVFPVTSRSSPSHKLIFFEDIEQLCRMWLSLVSITAHPNVTMSLEFLSYLALLTLMDDYTP